MTDYKESEVIDIRKVIRKIKSRKKLFVKTLPIAFVVSCVYILFIPRYYKSSVMLAPELENSVSGGSLSSLASSFGVNLGSAMSNDAISPMLYPDLIGSTDFIISLFRIPVTTDEGDLSTTYYEYMQKHQKVSIWSMPLGWLRDAIGAMFKTETTKGKDGIDAFRLTKVQKDVVDAVTANISCSVDKKTDVITIVVTDQDPLICATMADSIRARLQNFITDYRTNKARIDMEYYEKLTREACVEYQNATKLYADFVDANTDVILESYKAKQNELENDMQLKYNTYSAINTQYQAAKAKVQERTPAFTILQGATVPIKPAGPKRMIFVLFMVFLTCMGTIAYILKDEFMKQLRQQ